MKKGLNLFLIVLALAGLAYGAYRIGDAVIRESDEGFAKSSGTSTASPATGDPEMDIGEQLRDNKPAVFAVLLVIAAILMVTILSTVRTSWRHRRNQHRPRWRLRG